MRSSAPSSTARSLALALACAISALACAAEVESNEAAEITEKFVPPWWVLLFKPTLVAVGAGLLLTGSSRRRDPEPPPTFFNRRASQSIEVLERQQEQRRRTKSDDKPRCHVAHRTLRLHVSPSRESDYASAGMSIDFPLLGITAASRDPVLATTAADEVCRKRMGRLARFLKDPKTRAQAIEGVARTYMNREHAPRVQAARTAAVLKNVYVMYQWVRSLSFHDRHVILWPYCKDEGYLLDRNNQWALRMCASPRRVRETVLAPSMFSAYLRTLVGRTLRD